MKRALFALLSSVHVVASVAVAVPSSEGDHSNHATPTSKPRPTIQSFAKFEPALRTVCDGLAQEGRSLRIFELAVNLRKEERKCLSCRAFWASMSNACRPPKVITPKPKKVKKKGADEGGESEPDESASPPPPTPTSIPARRYPNPAILDAISRVAIAMCEYDAGGESAKSAVDTFADQVLAIKDLTPGERDYYEIIAEFFRAPWQGIPGTPTPKVEEDLNSFFD